MSFQVEIAHQVHRTINEKQTTPKQTTVKFLNIGNKEKSPKKKSQTGNTGQIPRARIQHSTAFSKSTPTSEDARAILSIS